MHNVIIESNLDNLLNNEYDGYQAFIYCRKGSCILTYNEGRHEMNGDSCAIILNKKFLKDIQETVRN